jgi:membrane protease YdiL (CAAX protease family)
MIVAFIVVLVYITFTGSNFTGSIGEFPKYLEVLISLPPILAGTFIARTVFDQRTVGSLGLTINRRMFFDLFIGLGIAALMLSLIFLIEWLAGWVEIKSMAWNTTQSSVWILGLLGWLGYFIAIGFQEELIFRGYQLQNLIEGLDLPKGLLISSLFFTIAHALNPYASLLSTVGILFAGIFFAYAWMRTKQLWLPIGLHIGWNFFEGVIFGFPVSGTDTFRLIQHTVSGPSFITGGEFGPEAGLVLLPALALGTFLVWFSTRSRAIEQVEPSLADALFGPHLK